MLYNKCQEKQQVLIARFNKKPINCERDKLTRTTYSNQTTLRVLPETFMLTLLSLSQVRLTQDRLKTDSRLCVFRLTLSYWLDTPFIKYLVCKYSWESQSIPWHQWLKFFYIFILFIFKYSNVLLLLNSLSQNSTSGYIIWIYPEFLFPSRLAVVWLATVLQVREISRLSLNWGRSVAIKND